MRLSQKLRNLSQQFYEQTCNPEIMATMMGCYLKELAEDAERLENPTFAETGTDSATTVMPVIRI